MKHSQHTTQSRAALFRNGSGIDTLVKISLCCVAAGITALPKATAEAFVPHGKLRGAASPEASLTAQTRQLAQPVMGYKRMPQENLSRAHGVM